MTDIQPGTTVYNRSGHCASFLSRLPHAAYAVRPQITIVDHEGEAIEDFDGLAEWHEIFLSPPVAKLNEEVAALNVQIEGLEAKRDTVRQQLREQDAEINARKERLKQHELLARLDDYVAGKITHYLILENYDNVPRVITLKETKGDDHQKAYRLLYLKAETTWGGKVEWKLSQYRDGSCSTETVLPCCSREEAIKEGTKVFEAMLAKWRGRAQNYPHVSPTSLIRAGKNLGLLVPEDVLAADRAATLQSATKTAEDARAALTKAEAQLAALQ